MCELCAAEHATPVPAESGLSNESETGTRARFTTCHMRVISVYGIVYYKLYDGMDSLPELGSMYLININYVFICTVKR